MNIVIFMINEALDVSENNISFILENEDIIQILQNMAFYD